MSPVEGINHVKIMPEIRIVPAFDSQSEGSELILLEFQGKFETAENSPLAGMEVGRLDLSGVAKKCCSNFINFALLSLYFLG